MQETKPLISIIVPVYNAEQYLEKCVNSIINQTYTNLEIILVDDGSPDNCGAICDEYAKKDSRIKVIHEKNSGQSIARNAGLDNATGEFVGFIDSDDTIEPGMFEDLYNAIQGVDLAVCGHSLVYDGKVESASTDNIIELDKEGLWREVFGKLNNAVWNKLFKRELINDLRFDLRFAHGEDLIFNIRYLERANLGKVVDKPLYNYYKRNDSITTGKFTRRKLLEIDSKDEALRLVKNLYPTMENVALKYCFRARMNILRHIFKDNLQKEYREEIKQFKSYVCNNYKSVKNQLKKKERLEFFMFKHCQFLYKLLAKCYQ